MDKKIENLIRKTTLRDVEIKLKYAMLEGMIVPDAVFEIMKNLEDEYNQLLAKLEE